MNTFKVKYYNGKISKGFDASLLLEPDGWEIRFIDENNKSQIIFWELKGIKSDTFLGASNRFVYGSSAPKEVIECDTELFNKTLKSTYKNAFSVHQKYRFFENFSVLKILILTVLLISILLGFYFYLLPNIAVSIANKMPKSAEIELGNRIYESFAQNLDVDTILTSKVNQFSKFIDFDTDYPLHFTVVDDDEINAFALPGGNIIIFNGILEKMKSKEELAALMSHEVSHVKLRHSFKSMCRSLSGYLFISFLFGDVNAVAAILIENSNNIYNLKYSRELEEEADNNAVKILNANHINLKGMVDLFTMLDTYNKNNLKIPYFLSTHPLTKDRLSNAKTALKNQPNIIENKELEEIWMNIYLIEKFNNF